MTTDRPARAPVRPGVDDSAIDWKPALLLMAVAAVLRLYNLNSQLWIDEISALSGSIDRPVGEIATRWPGASSHVLYELMARIGLITLGEPLGIRLPAALFGIAGVGAFYLVARQLCARRQAVAVGGLFALSYHDVFFSQNARGYTTLIFFYLVATYLLIGFHRTGRIGRWRGPAYAVATALAAYANLFGVFILVGHVPVVLGESLLARRRRREAPVPVRGYMAAAVGGGVATGLLYLPFLGSLLDYVAANRASAAEGPRMGGGLIREVVEGLSAALFGPVGLALAVAVGVAGFVALYRRHRFGVLLLVVPLALQLVAMVAGGIGIHPRYMAMALPAVILIGGYGIVVCVEAAVGLLRTGPRASAAVATAALAVVVLASGAPLVRYYQTPKQDYLGAVHYVDSVAGPGDAKVGVQLAGHVIHGYYGLDYTVVERLDDLEALERPGRTVWLVTTLERLLDVEDPALFGHIRDRYQRVRVLPATVGDGEMRIYEASF